MRGLHEARFCQFQENPATHNLPEVRLRNLYLFGDIPPHALVEASILFGLELRLKLNPEMTREEVIGCLLQDGTAIERARQIAARYGRVEKWPRWSYFVGCLAEETEEVVLKIAFVVGAFAWVMKPTRI